MQAATSKKGNTPRTHVFAFIGALVIFFVISGLVLFWSSTQITRSYLEIMGNQAKGYASIAAANTHLSDEQVRALKGMSVAELNASDENKRFAELFSQSTLIDQIDYAYIMVHLSGDEVRYTVTPDMTDTYDAPVGAAFDLMWLLDVNIDPTQADSLAAESEGVPDELSRFGYWQPVDEEIFGTSATYVVNEDEWGKHICGYAPIYSVEGSYIGMVGVDLTAVDFDQYVSSGMQVLIVLLLIVAFVISLIFFIVLRQQRKEHLETLAQGESFTLLINTTNTLTFSYDPSIDKLDYTTKAPGQDLIRHHIEHYMRDLDRVSTVEKEYLDDYRRAVSTALLTPGVAEMEFKGNMGNGSRWYKVTYASVADSSGSVYRVVGRLDDMQRQKEIERRADHDGLSGLLNRAAAERRIGIALADDSMASAFILVDVDDFKRINDTMGHSNGDSVIRRMGEILLNNFRTNDIIYRLGGDEFAVFMQADDAAAIAQMKAQNIVEEVQAFSRTLRWDFAVSVSVGVAVVSPTVSTFDKLYDAADKALYKAKENGKDNFSFYVES